MQLNEVEKNEITAKKTLALNETDGVEDFELRIKLPLSQITLENSLKRRKEHIARSIPMTTLLVFTIVERLVIKSKIVLFRKFNRERR